jgi:hypothetical protein
MIKNLLLIGLIIYVAMGLIKPPVYKLSCFGGRSESGYITGCAPYLLTDAEYKDSMAIVQSTGLSSSMFFSIEVSRPGIFTSTSDIIAKSKSMQIHHL